MTGGRERTGDERPPFSAGPESESLLRLVDELTDRVSRGEVVDFEAELAAHPADADRLREVFAGLELLQAIHDSGATRADSAELPRLGVPVAGLLGDFRILREVGRGGMGVVYEAEQISLGRRVALKVFPFAGICAPRQLQRFQHEARAAASLHHPHIVPVFAVGCERGMHFYAMQYIDGRSLAEVMGELRPAATEIRAAAAADGTAATDPEYAAAQTARQPITLNCRQIAEWGAQAADALDYAHALGIVHRDIKPANLLLDARQRLWIADFGLAQIATAEGLTMTGDILGTLRYMSPEQAVGERGLVDQRTDVYSLGATLYELLSGQPVFGSADRAELLRKILHDDPQPLRRINPEVPLELATIVHKCLEREPESRYSTSSRLADDLRRFLNDQPIRARPPTWADRARKWSRRNRGLVRLLTVFSVLGLAVLLTSAVLIDRERQRTRFEQQARQAEERIAKQAQDALAVNHYVTQINRAERAFRGGDFAGTRELLDACEPDLRGFEWRFLSYAIREREPPVARHQGMAYSVRVSPDKRIVATTGQDGVRIWDARTFEPMQHLTNHAGEVNSAAFSPDGTRLATSGDDHTVRVWDTESWNEIAKLPHDSHVVAAMFLRGRDRLAAAQRHYSDARGKIIGENHVRLWDTENWTDLGVLYRHDDVIQSLDVTNDGRLFATGGTDGFACIWDVTEHRLRHRFLHVSMADSQLIGVNCVAFAHHSPTLAAASADGVVRLWNVDNGSLQGTLTGGPDSLQFAAFSPDDRLIAAGGRGDRVALWHGCQPAGTRTRCELETPVSGSLWAGAFLDEHRLLTAGRGGAVDSRDTRRLPECKRLPLRTPQHTRIAFTPDSRSMIVAGQGVKLMRCDDGTIERMVSPDHEHWTGLAISSDGARVLAAREPGKLAEWSTADWARLGETEGSLPGINNLKYDTHARNWLIEDFSRRVIGLYDHGRIVMTLGTSPGIGDRASASPIAEVAAVLKPDGRLQIWNSSGLLEERTGTDFYVATVSWDGRLTALGRGDGTFVIRPVTDPNQAIEFAVPSYVDVMFSPDGRTLAVIGTDASLQLWNVATGRKLLDLTTGCSHLNQVLFSPDGETLAVLGGTVSGEREIRLWTASGR